MLLLNFKKDFIESIEKELCEYFLDDPFVIVIFLNFTRYCMKLSFVVDLFF